MREDSGPSVIGRVGHVLENSMRRDRSVPDCVLVSSCKGCPKQRIIFCWSGTVDDGLDGA